MAENAEKEQVNVADLQNYGYTAQVLGKRYAKIGHLMDALQVMGDPEGKGEVFIYEVKIRAPKPEGDGEWFVMLKAVHEGKTLVGFSSGPNVLDTMCSALGRASNGQMRWVLDKFDPANSSYFESAGEA